MKYPSYPKYKDSEVEWLGEVPEHWEIRRLKHISEVHLSNIDKHSVEGQRDVLLCNYVDVYKNEKITSQLDFMRSTASDDQINRLTIFKDDVIITKDSETPSDIGVSALTIEDIPDLVCGYHLALVRPSTSSGGFLHYLFKSGFVRAVFEVESNGLTRYGLGKYSIENLTFASPSKKEQQSIANFLDAKTSLIDDLIAKKEKQIELLKEKRTAIINRAVTKGLDPDIPMKDSGIDWLGEVPEHWEVKMIKRITQVKRGASPRPIDDPIYFDENGDYAWVRIADVTASNTYLKVSSQQLSELGSSLSVKLEPGELFLSIAGSVGKPCITKIKCCIHDGFVYFPTLSMNKKFIYYIFDGGDAYKGLGKLGTQLNLNTETVGEIKIAVPPPSEQNAIVEYIDIKTTQIDTVATKLQTQIEKLREYRQSLISAAVTGKINIRCED